MKTDRILIVADDSPSSLKAVKYGYELAKRLKGKVALAGVVNIALAEGNVDAGIFPEEALLELKKHTEHFLYGLEHDYADGINTEIFAPTGIVKETILNLAREWDADMIITGTHGRTGLNRLLMGSVAESLLRDSPIPVLVVPMAKHV